MYQRLKNYAHLIEAFIANIYFGFPSKKITVIGVTGTDGKTTTTHLIHHILHKSGKKVAFVSSISSSGFHTTTPRAWDIQKALAESVKQEQEYFVLETTSHAIDQYRVWGVAYRVSVLTNVSHEHLYHHKTFQEYINLKIKLLLMSQAVIINRDDNSYDVVKKVLEENNKKYYDFSLKTDAAYEWNKKIETKIKGDYNRQNILAAYAVCRLIDISEQNILAAIGSFSLPKGRFDVVYDDGFSVVIDFAHTPNSIKHVLETISLEYKKDGGRIIHVFGAASQRDDAKRPLMGEASGEHSDIVILTEEDHRKESVEEISRAIAVGLEKKGFTQVDASAIDSNMSHVYAIIRDRGDAIEKAICLAKYNDVVVLTGKSHEKSLNRNGREESWDEYAAVTQALSKK